MKRLVFPFLIVLILSTIHGSAQGIELEDSDLDNNKPKSQGVDEEPEWVQSTPKSISSYYFVGMGTGKNKAEAREAAKQDALGQVVLIVNSIISTNNQFETIYEENSSADKPSLVKTAYSKIKVKGETAIKNFQIKNTFFQEDQNGYVGYVLGEVPKSTIKEIIENMKKIREELAQTPTIIVAISVNSETKKIYYNESLKSFLANFYKSQGYKLINLDIDPQKISGETSNAQMKQLKEMVANKCKKIIFASILVSNAREEELEGYRFFIVEGTLSISELLVGNNEITSVHHITGKGISKYNFEKAFLELEKGLVEKLIGNQEEEGYN